MSLAYSESGLDLLITPGDPDGLGNFIHSSSPLPSYLAYLQPIIEPVKDFLPFSAKDYS